MMMKSRLQVSGRGSAILNVRLRGINDLEEVAWLQVSHDGGGWMILKAWLQAFSRKTIGGGGPRVSSGGGGAMTALGRNEGPTKDEKGPIPGRQWWMVG